ncbi:lipocalin family protein [Flavihumibacter petaseus]|uniref:Uncharacterized protein n=1 Tax=Flavihumibacter petaseus NBRC 106054 TaxID=1220578 RepID=A0A0E9N7U3_9BACT|nr:lipocalin family protein [Flavihumibacter petaseus]GAO45430.1 hypothetical protein FPE01S_05_01250 [Flavihumibacter petaseus NBRC 106054]
MKILKTSLLLLLTAFLACSKSKSDNLSKQTVMELLVNKKWQLTSITGTTDTGNPIIDQFPSQEDYIKDDYLLFNSDLTFIYSDNIILNPQLNGNIIESGTWKVTDSDTYIELLSDTQQEQETNTTDYPTKIVEISARQMKWDIYTDFHIIYHYTFKAL